MEKGERWYVPTSGLRRELLRETHDAKWASHSGEKRTLALLAKSYYWPKIGEDVQAYVKILSGLSDGQDRKEKGCRVAATPPLSRKTLGEHSMDFITGFPKVHDFKSIFVIVDRFSKYSVFIPAPNACPTEEVTRLFFNHVLKHFGLPQDSE